MVFEKLAHINTRHWQSSQHDLNAFFEGKVLKRNFICLEGLLSFIRVWGSKNDRFHQQQQQLQQQLQQHQARQVRMLQSENFLEQVKSHPSDTFFYFLNLETLTSVKSV